MNKEIKERWVKALRSGEYKQGYNQLYNSIENSYCCLGVLCSLYKEDHPKALGFIVGDNRLEDGFTPLLEEDFKTDMLPLSVQVWAELDSINPRIITDISNVNNISLADLNDEGINFDEIANVIEEKL